MKHKLAKIVLLILGVMIAAAAYAHCEIPCGIYGDSMRVAMIREHVETIEKSMTMIDKLSADKKPDYNQLVRWVNNKEEHANKIQEIATQYFMFQRIKPVMASDKEAYTKYLMELELMHRITVLAMKCKQSTDVANAKKILLRLDSFERSYFGMHDH